MAATKVKNVTFSLPVEIIEKFKEYAQNHYITSLNAGVKEALEEYAKRIEKEKLMKEMQEAAKDPIFMKDLVETMNAFEYSDIEIARRVQEW
jgi:metal-responsive CopG/Arc/MetJ family transcriptional regulator